MKAKTSVGVFARTSFAGNEFHLRITLSFTYATNEYCKDEPCKGKNVVSTLYTINLSVCLYVVFREREREREREVQFIQAASGIHLLRKTLSLYLFKRPKIEILCFPLLLSVYPTFTCFSYL